MRKKYKLIKEYPGCHYKLNETVIHNSVYSRYEGYNNVFYSEKYIQNNPEFWEEVKEEPNLFCKAINTWQKSIEESSVALQKIKGMIYKESFPYEITTIRSEGLIPFYLHAHDYKNTGLGNLLKCLTNTEIYAVKCPTYKCEFKIGDKIVIDGMWSYGKGGVLDACKHEIITSIKVKDDILFINDHQMPCSIRLEETKSKDYEIIAYYQKNIAGKGDVPDENYIWREETRNNWKRYINGNFVTKGYNSVDIKNNKSYGIYAVRRLSDGVDFKIGDIVELVDFHPIEITEFCLQEGIMMAKGLGTFANINYFKNNTKKPLFKTEDGKDIYECDKFYYVEAKELKIRDAIAKNNVGYRKEDVSPIGLEFKYFYYKEAAEKYIQDNKPLYSYREIEQLLGINYQQNNGYNGSKLLKQMKDLKK